MTPARWSRFARALTIAALLASTAANAEATHITRWTHSFYFPASAAESNERIPLIVYLHGCQQFRWHAEKTTRLLEWAEKLRFAVLMPEQSRFRNPWKCWNWFLGDDSLEMDEIVELVRGYQERFPLLKLRTYVMGLSAGGILTAHLLACRPDVFAAGAVFAGAAYRTLAPPRHPRDLISGASPLPAEELGQNARQCRRGRHPVSLLVVHGSLDFIARPRNGKQVAEQFVVANHLRVHGRRGVEDALKPVEVRKVPARGGRHAYTWTRYLEADGARVELVEVDGMGHSYSGGPWWLPFSDEKGPDGTAMALRTFGFRW